MSVILVDNYDSFTWNVADLLGRLGAEVEVVRNDAITVEEILDRVPSHVVISPGPGTPEGAAVSLEVARGLDGVTPILGICLGMQCIAHVHGARVGRLAGLVHGAASDVHHDRLGVLADMPDPFAAGRYHSLAVDEDTLPAVLVPTAHTADGVLMGIRHRTLPIEGVQFHPESILTPEGERLLARFLALPGCAGGS